MIRGVGKPLTFAKPDFMRIVNAHMKRIFAVFDVNAVVRRFVAGLESGPFTHLMRRLHPFNGIGAVRKLPQNSVCGQRKTMHRRSPYSWQRNGVPDDCFSLPGQTGNGFRDERDSSAVNLGRVVSDRLTAGQTAGLFLPQKYERLRTIFSSKGALEIRTKLRLIL